ncbi:MAG: type II toxin-antitoxin system HicB family antitoxin [Deltaproteobacteria bacterium]|nr:type II toxin-antitoxin system HicB family antitoxin [Deltaproteobacteria bacterium]
MNDITGYWALLYEDPEDGTIVVEFPDHPTVITYGNDREDAIEMGREALNAALESDYDRHVPLPTPSNKPRAKKGHESVFIPLEPDVRTAFLVRGWREASGLSQSQMAKRMGISTQAYQRMERPGRSNLTVATLDRIAHAVGKRLVLNAE